jgi:PIN domain nuclease of toxin-antitoxin system
MARLLLDNHAFLWWLDDAPQLSAAAIEAISDADNECYLSLASCWDDPFDRLLIAQAITEKLTIVTADKAFSEYSVKLLW